MSDADSFIDEVTEEVRRDRLFALFRKYGWIGVLAILLIVGTAAWREYVKAQNEAAAQKFGDAVTAAQAANDPAARVKALQGITAEGDRKAILKLITASDAVRAGDTKTATAALADVAGDAKLPQTFRDLAKLKLVMIAGDAMPADQRKAALEDLAQAGRPYRPLALEQLALMQVAKGDKAGAIKAYKSLLQEPQLTADLRRRATAMIVALGGNPAAS